MSYSAERINEANRVLGMFASDTYITIKLNQIYVYFKGKEWKYAVKRHSMHPVWSDKWTHGGTACRALFALVRWILDKPTLPISTWKMWSGNNYRLVPNEAIKILTEAGYPVEATCVKCGKKLEKGFDWWDDGKISGPAHFNCEN